MAFSARELVLILRATNQASGPIRQVSRDLRSLGSGATSAGRATNQLARDKSWARMGAASAILRDTGRSARLMGIAVGAGLGFAATGAAKFQTQAGLVATQTGSMNLSMGRTTEQMKRNAQIIEQGILKQMGKFPAVASEMNDALYEIYSSTELGSQGIHGVTDGLKLLNLMNKAAVAGQVDLSDITAASTSVMNAFGGGVKAMPKRLERMFAAVRFGRMTFADFVSTFSQIVPATQAAGQSFDTMTGTMAALTRLMPNVRFAATAYARMLEIFGRKKFVEGAKKFGVEMQDAQGNLRPIPDLIADFRTEIDKLPLKERAPMIRNFFKEMSNTEGTIQARRAFTALIKHTDLYQQVLGQTVQDNNEFTKSFRLMADTAGVKWETFVNRMRATFIKLGAAAIPILLQLLEPVERLAEWFNKMDASTRKQIINWAAMGAAITILGGTLASIAGTWGMILAALKIPPVLFLSTLAGIAAALLLISGNGNLVKTALDNMFSSATSSAKNFAIFMAATTLAVMRLRGAMISTAAVAQATSLFGGIGAGARRGREAFGVTRAKGGFNRELGKFMPDRNLTKATRSANALRAAFAGSAIAAAGVGTALLPTIGIIAAIGAGALIWSHHQKKVADEAERLAKFRAAAAAPTTGAQNLGGLGQQLLSFREAKINLRDVNFQIKEQIKSMKGLTGSAREQAKINLDRLWLRYGEAVRDVSLAQQRITTSSGSLKNALQGVAQNMRGVVARRAELASLRKEFGYMDVAPSAVIKRMAQLQQEIKDLETGAAGFGGTITKSMGQALRMLERVHRVPQMTAKQFDLARTAAARFATATGRAPTEKEFRQIVKAVLDPSSAKNIPAQIKRAVGDVKIMVNVGVARTKVADLNRQVQDAFRHREPTIAPKPGQLVDAKSALAGAQGVYNRVQQKFAKPITQHIKVTPPKNLEAIGARISQGIQQGMQDVHQQVVIDKVVNSIERGFLQSMEAKSPSRRFARTVGIPLVQGVIVGILSKAGEAADAAVFVLDQIEGKSVAKMTSMMQKQASVLNTMNNNLQRLVRRGVPLELIEQLAQMGKEGAAQVAKLASGSQVELRKFVAAWKRANSEVKESARFNWTALVEFVDNGAKKLLDLYNQARDNLRDFAFGSMGDFVSKAKETADTIAGAFGQIFQGPMNIAEHIGSAFDDAQASYASSMAGLQEQMEELQQRQADTIADFMERRRDELRTAFGKLFSGPILSAGFAAGSVKDLIADLNKQLADFQDWRKNLDSLGKRGVPQALMKSLEELGPEASHNMSLLVNATDDELKAWVDAWKAGDAAIEEVTQATYMNMDGFAEAMADIAKQMAKVAQQMSELVAPKKATFATLQQDLEGQMTAWRDYNGLLTSLQAKGVPGMLLSELAALGIEGVDILRILNSGTETELANYIGTWNTKQAELKAAKKAWQETLAPEEILTTMGENADALREFDTILQSLATRGLSPAILQQLREMGPEALPLLRGLNSMTEEQLITGDKSFVKLWKETHGLIDTAAKEFVDGQVALWREQGSKIAAGLIAGVMDEQAQLLSFFRGLFKNLLAEAKKETQSHSPSQVYYDLGRNIVEGFQLGLSSMTPSIAMPSTGSIAGAFSHRAGGGINMTVNAHHSESLQSTLERTSFRMRQRRVN